MKELLKKEFTLTASPVSYIFIAFALMTFIPGYPIAVSGFFLCLGLQITFQFAREHNDILYTVLLPVSKTDAVKARYLFCVCIQMMSFAASCVMTAVRMTVLSDKEVYVKNVMLSANLTYLTVLLIIYALFNIIFVGGFFKTAYFYGKVFVEFIIASFIVIGISETLHHIPGLEFLNAVKGEGVGLQAGIFAGGILIYVVGTLISMNVSIKRFEALDL